MKAKNSINNIISGIIKQLVLLVLGLIIPRLILVNYGSEVNGFMSSVTQLVTYLALLEVGVGTATLQSLYKPVYTNNREKINSIMAATHQYYIKTGVIYAILVTIFAFIYPTIVESNIPKATVIIFILLSGLPGVLNYLVQGKYKILLQAEGKNYIITNLTTLVNLLINISKIILINFNVNIIVLQSVFAFINILQMIFINWYINRNYKWINLNVKRNYGAISQSKSVMLHEISYMIFNHTDILILTVMCDLKIVSIYTIYNMIVGQVESLISTFISSVQFILGQIYSKSIEEYKKIYNIFEMVIIQISFCIFTIAYIFITPFINIYTKDIADTNYLLPLLPTLFIVVKVLTSIRTVINQTIIVGGYFSSTQKMAIIEATINLIISIFLVRYIGIYGILIGTIIGLVFRIIYMIVYINNKVIKRSLIIPLKRILVNMILLFVIGYFFKDNYIYTETYLRLIIDAMFLSIFIIIINILICFSIERKTINEILVIIKNKLYLRKNKFKGREIL